MEEVINYKNIQRERESYLTLDTIDTKILQDLIIYKSEFIFTAQFI